MLDIIQRLGEVDPRRGMYLYEDFFSPPTFLPYASFPDRVAACAEHFRAQGIQRGEHVILPFESEEAVFFSFFGLMEVGAIPLSVKPYIFSTPRQSYVEFLGRISERYGARRVLDAPSLSSLELTLGRVPLPPTGAKGRGARLREVAPEELAFVQFSSGSTSFPKGVPITQRNLRANLRMIAQHDGRTAEDRGVSWLPLYHDMGLIGILTCVYSGMDAHLTQPISFLMEPLGWLELMSKLRASISVIPNFAIDYSLKTLRDLEPQELERLELSALRTIYLGSEPINIPNLERFTELLAPRGFKREAFKPCYGMAEAVLMVSCVGQDEGWRVVSSPHGQPAISVGRPLQEFEVRLRTEDGRVCGERESGEIELRGGSLAASYYADERPLLGAEGFYATGDLGFMDGGELFITGRVNDRIKINGQSYFSSDFEQAIERLPFIRPGRTVVIQTQGRVVVLAEAHAPAALEPSAQSHQQVCAAILESVGVTVTPQDVLFIRYGQIRKTSSGKLQRRAMTEAYEQGRIRVATPMKLRADLLRMHAQRLFYGSLLEARKRGKRWLQSGRTAAGTVLQRFR
ncbi:AMP-binding protein [Hyalangium sp.]|uniref:AMP-binding protein n=1 Tax=Hyalangium sp. TaxID=2028555 RepID=UPI002D601F1B|nr:AMP-binding protein [Hyalangium sp.]HYH97888.1 AMP-binding protein [Hyalangium sp.]